MEFNEFLECVRDQVGKRGSDEYWKSKFNDIRHLSRERIKKEIAFLAPAAVADDLNRDGV